MLQYTRPHLRDFPLRVRFRMAKKITLPPTSRRSVSPRLVLFDAYFFSIPSAASCICIEQPLMSLLAVLSFAIFI